jgi:uncharacterized membrane protein (UPF0127 family)
MLPPTRPRPRPRAESSLRLAALLVLAVFVSAGVPGGARAQAPDAPLLELASFPRSVLTIHTQVGRGHVFRVWIADSPQRQEQGLMFVRDLPADEGMLFVNDPDRVVSMWMKNTFIPLDMLFIDARGQVVAIFERTVPQSLAVISHPKPVRAVLEIAGGDVIKFGIKVGDQVDHSTFRAARK